MADPKRDQLNLKYSTPFDISGIEENVIDIQLTPSTTTVTTVYGTVLDGQNPVPDATVKVFDNTGTPYAHTLTDNSGEYSIEGIPSGTYTVAVAKNGYRLSPAKTATLDVDTTLELDFAITADTTLTNGVIAGILTTTSGEKIKPVAGAKFTLMQGTTVIAITYSADDGEYAFYDVVAGDYTIVVSSTGYLNTTSPLIKVTSSSITNLPLSIGIDERTYNGTVNGIIKNGSGASVEGCFVGLYKVTGEESSKTETLVAVTKTNASGKYLFGSVEAGNYVVKAKM